MGPKEVAVRATLPDRPAGILHENSDLRRKVNHCFAGIFNGARQGRVLPDGGLFVGKAECEWDWQEVWPAMKDLGLVDYTIEDVTHPTGYVSKEFRWNITDKGHDVREDDLRYFRELMDAMDAERPPRVTATEPARVAPPASVDDPDACERDIAASAWR